MYIRIVLSTRRFLFQEQTSWRCNCKQISSFFFFTELIKTIFVVFGEKIGDSDPTLKVSRVNWGDSGINICNAWTSQAAAKFQIDRLQFGRALSSVVSCIMHGTSRAGWPSEYKWLRAVPFLPPCHHPARHGCRFLRVHPIRRPGC